MVRPTVAPRLLAVINKTKACVQQASSGYVELLQDTGSLVAGDVLKVVGESKRGTAWKVAEDKDLWLSKGEEGSRWQWTVSPEEDVLDDLVRDAREEHPPFQKSKQTKRVQEEFQGPMLSSDAVCSDQQNTACVQQASSGYVELLQDTRSFVAGDVLKVVGESMRGTAWKVAEDKDLWLSKSQEGSRWQWTGSPEEDVLDDLVRDAREAHLPFQNSKQTKRVQEEFQDPMLSPDDEFGDQRNKACVQQSSSGYVELLQDTQNLVAGDVLKVVGESKRGFAWKVAEDKDLWLSKSDQGSRWQWTGGPEEDLPDLLVRDATGAHGGRGRLRRRGRKRQRTGRDTFRDMPVEHCTPEADSFEHHQGHLAHPWVEINSQEGIYYWNELTGESQWERPHDPECSEVEDAENTEDNL